MLFVDFSLTFKTISPIKLIGKLWKHTLVLSTTNCKWILDTCSTPVQYRSTPGLCAQPPPVHTVHPKHPSHQENSIVKHADDTTIISHIQNDDECSYQEQINNGQGQEVSTSSDRIQCPLQEPFWARMSTLTLSFFIVILLFLKHRIWLLPPLSTSKNTNINHIRWTY